MLDVELIKGNHPIEEVCELLDLRLTGYPGGTRATKCYNHEDNHPSLVIMPDANRYECKACGESGDTIDLIQKVKGLDFKEAVEWLEPSAEHKTQSTIGTFVPITPKEYIQGHGIKPETLAHFGITVGTDRITIPLSTGEKYLNPGSVNKWLHKKGTIVTLFKTDQPTKSVILTEGEFDGMRVWQETGLPAWSGTSGCQTFKPEWKQEFEGIETIYVAYDNDDEGRAGAARVMEILGYERCVQIEVPKEIGKDWCDYFSSGNSADDFMSLIEDSKPATKQPVYYSGFKLVDESIGGFRSPGTYLIAGYEKSGKSTLLLNFVKHFVQQGIKVGYLDTELSKRDVLNTIAVAGTDKSISEAEKNEGIANLWAEEYGKNFLYAGISDLTNSKDELDFDLTAEKARDFISNGAEVLIFDNLTVFSLMGGKNDWAKLAKCEMTVINMAKKYRILAFPVIHTRSEQIYTTTPEGLRSILKSSEPLKIFEESVTVVLKPTGKDIYGGGGARSQFTGTIIVWRPYQLIASEQHRQQGMLVFESFRYTQAKGDVRFLFDGDKKTFTELAYQHYEIEE